MLPRILCFLFFIWSNAEGNCKTHDAEWHKGKSPKVTIPHRNDPGKVLVDWTNIIKNGRCADRFNVFVWETHRGEAFTKNFTSPQGTYSKVVELDPCVEYQIKVGFTEADLFGREKENSTVANFKTEAIPTLGAVDQSKFVVQVYFDYITQKLDYNKASIKFPKNVIQHTSCLKHIEANGIETVATLTSSRGYMSRFKSSGDLTSLSRSTSYSSIASGRSRSSSIGGSSTYSGSSYSGPAGGYNTFGVSGSYGGSGTYGQPSSTGGGGTYGSSSSQGSGGTYGSSTSHGGGGTYGSSNSYGGGGTHGSSTSGKFMGSFKGSAGNHVMDPYNYHDGEMDHDHSFGNHGRGDFDKVNKQRFKRGLFGNKKTTTPPSRYGRPGTTPSTYGSTGRSSGRYSTTTQRPITGSTVSAKIVPPFVDNFVEIVIPIKPCSSYTFTVKFVSPQGAVLGTVKDLKLPQLSEMHNYHPPTLAEIFKVGKPTSANAPFISLEPYSGIPVECVLPVLKAVDRHMGHLEDELHYHLKKEFESIEYGNKMKAKFLGQKEGTLESAGCECSTPLLHFNTSDPKQLKKHAKDGVFGSYVFEGMQNGKPYYRRPPTGMVVNTTPTSSKKKKRTRRFVGKVPGSSTPTRGSGSFSGGFSRSSSSSSHHSSSSSSHGGVVLPNTPIIKDPPPPGKVYYVFWNSNEKAWWVAETLQSNKPFYKTEKNNPAKCPGDTKTVKKWQASHTFSWKVDPHMVMTCRKQVY